MSYESLLILTATIKSKTETQSNSGAKTFAWADKLTSVKTRRVRNLHPKIYDELAKTYIDDYKFYFLLGTNLTVSDKIVLDDGSEYEILGVDNDSSNHHVKVYAKKTSL